MDLSIAATKKSIRLTKDLRGKKDVQVEEEDMQFGGGAVNGKETKSPSNTTSDEEDKRTENSSSMGTSNFFSDRTSNTSSRTSSDSDLEFAHLYRNRLRHLSINHVDDDEDVYFSYSPPDSPPVKLKPSQSSYWVPSCARDIKLLARIFSCESMKELEDLKADEQVQGEYFNGRRAQLMRENKKLWKYEMMEKLIAFVPYIEGRKYIMKEKENLLWAANDKNLVQCEDYHSRNLIKRDFFDTLEMCIDMFKAVEGDKMFHPLIRMGHKDDLLKLISLYKRAHIICKLEFMQMNPERLRIIGLNMFRVNMSRRDCMPRKVIERFFADKRNTDRECVKAKERVSSIRRFESHLISIDFEKVLEEKMSIDIVKKDTNNLEAVARQLAEDAEIVPEEYRDSIDDEGLIKQSLEERLFFVQMYERLNWYGSWLYDLLEEKDKDDGDTMVDLLIRSRGGVRFFECTKEYKEEGSVDQSVWEEKEVRDFIEAVEKEVFPDLPMQYVVRGILDYRDFLRKREEKKNEKDFLEKCHEEIYSSIWQQIDSLEEYWRKTRYFDHKIYKNSVLLERIDWGEIEDIEKSLNDILMEMEAQNRRIHLPRK